MKKVLRNKFKNLRNNLKSTEVLEKSNLIFNKLISSPMWINSKRVMCYLSINNEVKTDFIVKEAWKEGKEIVVPVCEENFTLKPCLIKSFDDLEPKKLGILEPKKEKINYIDPKSIDLCLIPGIAFDLQGYRLGYGAGYYDRFLPLLKQETPKVALAFEIQISTSPLPIDRFDVPMDYIITEKRLIKLKT